MVRAHFANRKRVTRRIPTPMWRRVADAFAAVEDVYLWGRETWQALSFGDDLPTRNYGSADFRYAATDAFGASDIGVRGYPWRPSIHMPRAASRLTHRVTDVRVEPLQACGNADALAEGIDRRARGDLLEMRDYRYPSTLVYRVEWTPVDSYRSLWNFLHGAKAGETWADNPTVYVIAYETLFRNIDGAL